jgi:peroxiredoxin
MAVQSGRTQLGMPLPDVTLADLDGNRIALDSYRGGRPLVVAFACNHCPYVRHVEGEIARVAAEHPGVAFVAIMSNDVSTHPDDDIPGLRDQLERSGWDFPYLIDADQAVALEFGAVCTPDFFVFDRSGRLAYRGALDASSPKNGIPLTGELLRAAVQLIEADQPVPEPQRPAMGCGIKWLPGNEPEAVSFV